MSIGFGRCALIAVSLAAITVTAAGASANEPATDVTCLFARSVAISQNSPAAQGTSDWLERVQKDIAADNLASALHVVELRLAAVPDDSDALGWRAQILAWTGRRKEADEAYRRALQLSPRDGDFLLGLATLLAEQGRNADALVLLDAALQVPPPRADVFNERGRVLRALNRMKEARAAFLQAQALEPANISPSDDEARAGLRSLELPPRLALEIGNETDTFNYTGVANAQTITFVANLSRRWIVSTEGDIYQRFGVNAGKVVTAATYRLTPSDSFSVAGGAGEADGIIPRAEAYFEYGHGFRVSETNPVRGIETSYNQHWLWYEQARVLVLTGSITADLARDFRWTISASGARSRFSGTPPAWEPSGSTRLDLPIPRISANRLLMNLTFAVGSENFNEFDQVGAFASRTYGGGFRLGLRETQHATFYFARQYRNGGNSEGIYGMSYGIRF